MRTANLIGRVGNDLELRHTANGTAVCEFSLAVNEYRGEGDQRTEYTHWFRIVVWGKQAVNLVEHIGKGDQLGVTAQPSYHEWTDNGQKRSVVKFTADQITYGARKRTTSDEHNTAA